MRYDLKHLEFDAVREMLSQHCISEMGRRRVREIMPTSDRKKLTEDVSLVREMMKLLSEKQEPPIHGLRDAAAHLKKVAREKAILEPGELLELRDFCDTAGKMRRAFEPLQHESPALHALAMPLQGVPALVRSIEEKIALNSTVRDTASELLARLRADIFQTEQQIQKDLTRLVRELAGSGDLQDDFYTLRNERYVLPVKTSNRGKVQGIIHDSSNTGETVFIEPFAILELSNKLADLRLSEREEIYRILLRVAGHIRDEMNALLTNLEILTEFDLVYAKSRFGVINSCAFPSFSTMEKPINLVDAHHPLLYAQSPASSRPLNIGLDTDDRVLVITGPNAGGKTTALKTIGLIALMVQTSIPAPLSSRSRIPIFEQVMSAIGDEQNIMEGVSTFSAHVRQLVSILKGADGAALVLLDELGTATDPGEGGALAVAILESLAERGTLTIVSSHLGVLKNWAFSYPYARNASFRLSEKDRRPTFHLFLDLPGISEALVIAEQAGVPAEIIARAKSLRPETELDATALLLSLQEKEQKLAQQLDENEKLSYELEYQKSQLQDLEARLREEKRTYRNQLLAEKERTLNELRSRVEGMIAKLPSKQELLETRRELEQEISEAAEERKSAPREKPLVEPRELSKGDRVTVTSLNDQGIIDSVDKKKGTARVAIRQLVVNVKLDDIVPLSPEKLAIPEAESYVHYRRPTDMEMTLDLHGNRVEEALAKAEKFMDNALAAGLSSVRIMHGQGSGVLRRALHEHFRTYPVIKNFRFGTPGEGGGAVTIVEFK